MTLCKAKTLQRLGENIRLIVKKKNLGLLCLSTGLSGKAVDSDPIREIREIRVCSVRDI